MSEHGQRKSPQRPLAPRPSILQHVPQKTIKKTKTRISNACTACKARKTKCDNNKPKCTACTARPNSECVYFPFLDKRKRQHSTNNRDSKAREHELLNKIFNATKYCSKEELPKLLELIRGDASIEQIAEYIQDKLEDGDQMTIDDELVESSLEDESMRGDHGEIENEMPSSPSTAQSYHRSRRSKTIDAMDIGSIVQISIPDVPSQPWTNVTTNDEFVSHLIQLYFTWEAPVYDFVEKAPFISEMRSGNPVNSRYCSPLLVNAMLASACRYSDRDASFEDRMDPESCGNHFFEEAKRLWQAGSQSTSLTNMQSLVIMHYFEAHRANDGVGIDYFDAGMNMYQELASGIYDSGEAVESPLQLSWPCWKLWICRCFASLVLREPYFLSPPNLPEPAMPDQVDLNDTWHPYPQLTRSRPFQKMETARQCIELAKVVQTATVYLYSNNATKYEPSGILDIHQQFQAWYEGYLKTVNRTDSNLGPNMTLRIWYHALELHLFRGSISDTAPVCSENTKMISSALDIICNSAKLQRTYFQLYGAKATILLTYNSFQSALFTLYFLEFQEYHEAFIEHVKMLSRLAKKRGMSAFQLYIVKVLARREEIQLPNEVLEIFQEIEPARLNFERRLSKIPVPALSSKAATLIKFKEELLSVQAMAMETRSPLLDIDSRSSEDTMKKSSLTRLFDEIDPVLGGLSDFYQQMLTLEDKG
ncbi:hypothetical protein TWF225_008319 [Orbilia oligospora]|nr:hypothetical protein TWF225_008319 [Orbilia oligospora]KAF3254762.1 hypothetical protein TWF128_006077 [Orbilia oligospora]KAF3254763.1 hypothetical protein TWF128_006077 [Orbilia oligospora]KAF3269056.1 hypothetical protein TWF217_010326 [Orbilia oligospora]KAF3290545.1 hypothetical protein TWF132_006867 [Orbilia oligospora]